MSKTSVLKKPVRDFVRNIHRPAQEPIAIVGMSGRFPGATTLRDFRFLISDGVDATGELPPNRWSSERYYSPTRGVPGKSLTRRGAFIDEIDCFDSAFFRLTRREAQSMDPGHRLLLELAWEAFESAAMPPSRVAGSATGVFVGMGPSIYGMGSANAAADAYYSTGLSPSVAVGRVSHFFNLTGSSEAIDTACSAASVAVHRACQALSAGEIDRALAGGVNALYGAEAFIALSQAGMLAPDGRCKTFDEAADGFARAEGGGLIVLERLSDARAHRDRVLAVITGTAVNHSGRTQGLTAPNGPAQQRAAERALVRSNLEAGQVQVVEAHGTGTSVGDSLEARAMSSTFRGAGLGSSERIVCGTVKTNVGHLEVASGIAGLLKMVLMLRDGAIYPHLNLERLNSQIDLARERLLVPVARRPWRRPERGRVGAVNCFSFSGSNAHVIVAEAPPDEAPRPSGLAPRSISIVPLAARSRPDLLAAAAKLVRHLDESVSISLNDLAYTAAVGRHHFDHRIAVRAAAREELGAALRRFIAGEIDSSFTQSSEQPQTAPRIVLLFGGAPADPATVRALYDREPAFRAALDECVAAATDLSRPLLDTLTGAGGPDALIRGPDAVPARISFEYALAKLWSSWGVRAWGLLGSGASELTAMCLGGSLDLPEVLAIAARWAPRGSNQDASAELERQASRYTLRAARCRVISGATGEPWEGGRLPPGYWRRVMEQPLQLERAVGFFVRSGATIFVECGGGDELSCAAQTLYAGSSATFLSSLPTSSEADHQADLSSCIAGLYARGVAFDWQSYHRDRECDKVELPTYPFQRTRHAPEVSATREPIGKVASADRESYVHPLLGAAIDSPGAERHFEAELSAMQPVFMDGYQLFGTAFLPPSALLEMAFAGARELWRAAGCSEETFACEFRDVLFHRPLVLPTEGTRKLHTVLSPDGSADHWNVVIYSPVLEGAGTRGWGSYLSAQLTLRALEPDATTSRLRPAMPPRGNRPFEACELYERYDEQELSYTGPFRGLEALALGRHGSGTASGTVPACQYGQLERTSDYVVHPVITEGSMQLTAAAAVTRYQPPEGSQNPFIAASIERCAVHCALTGDATIVTRLSAGSLEYDVKFEAFIGDGTGQRCVEMVGIQLYSVSRSAALTEVDINVAAQLRKQLDAASPSERWHLMLAFLRAQTADILGVSAEEVPGTARYPDLGITSLGYVELAGRIRRGVGQELRQPVADLTIEMLSEHLLREMVGEGGYERLDKTTERLET